MPERNGRYGRKGVLDMRTSSRTRFHTSFQDFIIDEQLITEFAEIEEHQFDNYNPGYKDVVIGLFVENDTLAHFEPLFRKYYNQCYHFPGGHTPTAEEVQKYYVPLIDNLCKIG